MHRQVAHDDHGVTLSIRHPGRILPSMFREAASRQIDPTCDRALRRQRRWMTSVRRYAAGELTRDESRKQRRGRTKKAGVEELHLVR